LLTREGEILELFRLFGTVLLHDEQAQQGLQNIDQKAEKTANRLGGLGKIGGVMGKAIAVGVSAAIGGMTLLTGAIAKTGIGYNAMAENSQVAWTTLLGTQEKAKKMFSDIADFAKKTQFDTTSVDMMAKYMFNAGYAGQQLFDKLTEIADVSGAFNIPAESAQELARQMSQVQQAGVAYTEDLNILQDRGVPIYKAISEQLGITVGDVKMMASQGKLTSDVYMKAFDDIANSVKGSADAQSQTFTGMVSTIKDQLSILAGALAKPLFEKLKAGMDKLMPALDALVSYASGDMKGFTETMDKTFGAGAGAKMLGFANGLKTTVDDVKNGLGKLKGIITAAFDFGKGDNIGGITILTQMGLGPETITKVVQVVNAIKSVVGPLIPALVSGFKAVKDGVVQYIGFVIEYWKNFFTTIKSLFSGSGGLGESFGKIFATAKSIVMPILSEIVSFVKEKIAMIKQFWDENGAQIIQAVQNAWAIIAAVFKFIAPVILFVVKMLWDTVAGLIDGALKIIMGLIKIFAGLFTGDFGKMWEGIKQLFIGAIQFVWNLINLLMFGRILGGIKAFITGGITHFTGFWVKVVEIFKNLDTSVWNVAKGMISKVLGFFRNLYTEGARIFGTLKTFGANTFSALWTAIKTVAGNIASGVKGFFLDMVTGAKFHMQGLLDKAKSIFNGIKGAITNPIETAKTLVGKAISAIKGFFSNMKLKIPLPHFNFSLGHKDIGGISVPFPKIDVDWYAMGTNFAPGGLAVVGERGPELVTLPRGSKVDTANETSKLLGKGDTTINVYSQKAVMDEKELSRTLQRLEVLYG
jgi:tape measure domain-containing protein